jgi:hypothetical protein
LSLHLALSLSLVISLWTSLAILHSLTILRSLSGGTFSRGALSLRAVALGSLFRRTVALGLSLGRSVGCLSQISRTAPGSFGSRSRRAGLRLLLRLFGWGLRFFLFLSGFGFRFGFRLGFRFGCCFSGLFFYSFRNFLYIIVTESTQITFDNYAGMLQMLNQVFAGNIQLFG